LIDMESSGQRSARVRVRDYGTGVPAAEQKTVFERFRRGSRHQDGSVPGMGLGLYLGRELMRQHAGELAYEEPEAGAGGACFQMTFPLNKDGARG
jgi:K+-sensing histidine kinase KdpD